MAGRRIFPDRPLTNSEKVARWRARHGRRWSRKHPVKPKATFADLRAASPSWEEFIELCWKPDERN